VRSIYADWELGDWSSATWAHPDIAYVMVDEPGSHVYVGLAEMARAWRSFLSAWEAYRVEPLDFRSLDRERVLVIVRAHGRGKSSGLELDDSTTHRGANLFHIRDGRVARLDAYFDAVHALADLGLTE
jgi:ketosteroid isomerase-like protein